MIEPSNLAPAYFCGWQPDWPPGAPPFALWTLTEEVWGHPVGSTVASETLRKAGYTVVEPEDDTRCGS